MNQNDHATKAAEQAIVDHINSLPSGIYVLEVHTDYVDEDVQYRRGQLYAASYDNGRKYQWELGLDNGNTLTHAMSTGWLSKWFNVPDDLQIPGIQVPTTRTQCEDEISCIEEWLHKIDRPTTPATSEMARYRQSHIARQNYLKMILEEFNV